MIKGTTPTLQFNLPFGTESIKSAEVVIEYTVANLKYFITKTVRDCQIAEKSLSVTLTQEETLRLPAPSQVNIQLRVLTNNDVALATAIYRVTVDRLLKEDVLK
jgi:hypothetical protein